jgi:hypothetical protein
MATKAKKTTTKKPAKKTVKTNGNGNGNKTQAVVALMRRAKGVTRAEILKVTGWKAVNVNQIAGDQPGYKIDTKERPFTYRCTG